MTEFQKAKQEAREVWELYKGSATARAKRFSNEEHYTKTLGGRSAVRITIPASRHNILIVPSITLSSWSLTSRTFSRQRPRHRQKCIC